MRRPTTPWLQLSKQPRPEKSATARSLYRTSKKLFASAQKKKESKPYKIHEEKPTTTFKIYAQENPCLVDSSHSVRWSAGFFAAGHQSASRCGCRHQRPGSRYYSET